MDVARLLFLSEEIQAALVKQGNCPAVNRAGESTVPGLYFAGAHTMTSLGPGVRFIAGPHHTSASRASSVAARAGKAIRRPEPAEVVALEAPPDALAAPGRAGSDRVTGFA